MTLPQPEADELLPIEQAMRAFYDGWPSFKAWWESIDNSYGGKMSFDDLPPEPFEAAIAIMHRAALPIAEEDWALVRNILVVTAAKTEAAREKATLPDAREWLASHAQRLREIAAKLEGK